MELYECDFLVWGWWEFNRAIVISFPKLRAVYYERKWDKRKWIKNTKQSEDERTGRLWWTWNVAVGLPELRKHVGYWELHSESSTRSTCAANVESPSNASGSLLGD